MNETQRGGLAKEGWETLIETDQSLNQQTVL